MNIKTLKGLIIGYAKGFKHNLSTGHDATVTYWKKGNKNRHRVSCFYCGKTHYRF